ncbi:MAG: hypothetical protein HFI90_07015 [Clostridia bacterium]|nr:hypothetical protein [Clostridia bacterium]
MYQPIYKRAKSNSRIMTSAFKGLNRADAGGEDEFVDMQNLSSDHYPYLSPRKSRTEICSQNNIKYFIAPQLIPEQEITAFTGVAGAEFYYNGVAVPKDSGVTIDPDTKKCLIDYNGYILIFPDKLYYCYTAQEEHKLKHIETGYSNVSLSFSAAGSNNDSTLVNKVTKTGGWSEFRVGDSLTINCEIMANNTVSIDSKYDDVSDSKIMSCVVEAVSGNEMTIKCVSRLGVKLPVEAGNNIRGSIRKAMPNITRACVCNNRVFGVDAAGEMIYASKLADFKNWNVFEGLSTDSWYAQVGTDGRFTGIVTYNQSVVAFKDNYIHLVYGDAPTNYRVTHQIAKGCIDGDSIAEVSGSLYFLSYDGIYKYSGGTPLCISDKVNRRYSAGVGGFDGRKYYLSAKNTETTEFLVFDTKYNVWHKEDDLNVGWFVRYNDGLYAASTNKIIRLNAGTETVEWTAESIKFRDNTTTKRSVNDMYFRVVLEPDSKVEVYARYDDYDWLKYGTLEPSNNGHTVMRVPVRFASADHYQYKLVGHGNAIIECVERKIYVGGSNQNRF